jgi:hypothetical protein
MGDATSTGGPGVNQVWDEIVAEALARSIAEVNGPISGARLRQSLLRVAEQRGLTYPPAGTPDIKFSDFLRQFENRLIVLRRPGRDILVAPADNPQLLVESSDKDRSAEFREDIFQAFTIIPKPAEGRPWYSVRDDQIRWMTDAEDKTGLIQIPPATWDNEVAIRRSFVDSLPEGFARQRLSAALESQYALRDFKAALAAARKLRDWHHYRFDFLVKTIRQWCTQNGLSWLDGWLKTAKEVGAQRAEMKSALPVSRGDREVLTQFLANLPKEDLMRIHVPLDLLMRMMESGK